MCRVMKGVRAIANSSDSVAAKTEDLCELLDFIALKKQQVSQDANVKFFGPSLYEARSAPNV